MTATERQKDSDTVIHQRAHEALITDKIDSRMAAVFGWPASENGSVLGMPFIDPGYYYRTYANSAPDAAKETGKLYYTPWLVPTVGEIVDLHLAPISIVAGTTTTNDHVRVALVAADENLQPVGEPLFDVEFALSDAAPYTEDIVHTFDSPVEVVGGRYLWAYQVNRGGWQLVSPQGKPLSVSSLLPAGDIFADYGGGASGYYFVNYFYVSGQTYGELSDPLPQWDSIEVPTASDDYGYAGFLYPVAISWNAASGDQT